MASNVLIMIGRRRYFRCSLTRWTRSLFVFVYVIFDLTLNIVLGIFEFANATAETTHQFRNFPTTEQQEHYECYEYNVRTAE
jgi:hypothetical protein